MRALHKILWFLISATPVVSGAQDSLVIISPHWEGIKTEFGRAFGEWHRARTGREVSIDWRDPGGGSDDLRFIISEYQHLHGSEGIGIDLFFGGGIDPFLDLKERHLLQTCNFPAEVLKGIPAEWEGVSLFDSGRQWFGAALSTFGILENKQVVSQMKLPEAKTWRDLANPALKGWVESGDPRNSGAMHMVYECILQSYGWEEGWKVIFGIGKNVRQFDRNGSAAVKACTLGNAAYSVAIDFYALMQIAEVGGDHLEFHPPPAEAILNPDSIAMLKGAPHQKIAEEFIRFVLSEEGQNLWLAPKGDPKGAKKFSIPRMAIRPQLYETWAHLSPIKTNPFRDLTPLKYNAERGALRWAPLNALLGALVIDRPRSERGGLKVPVTESELNSIARKEWKDPIQRNRLILSWQNQ